MNGIFRQARAEQAATALGALLASVSDGQIPCRAVTRVSGPGEAFDVYGRLVADVWIARARRPLMLNDWLLREGWAVPALYDSMQPEEIRRVVRLGESARIAGRGIWSSYRSGVVPFAPGRRFRKSPGLDTGSVMMPKLYRRQVSWWVNRAAGIFDGDLHDWVEADGERCFATATFLKQGMSAPAFSLAEVVGAPRMPDEIVLRERAAVLRDASGTPIVLW